MIKEFFLRRRAFKVGQNIRHMHEQADIPVHSGNKLLELAQNNWGEYCRSKARPYTFINANTGKAHTIDIADKSQKLLHNDYLCTTYIKGFIQGYLAEDQSQSWPDAYVKE